jgi:UDP-glucose 4-epimerase
VRRLNSSGYPDSQGAFPERVRREAEARLGLPCSLELGTQTEFPEPAAAHQYRSLKCQSIRVGRRGAWAEFVRFYHRAQEIRWSSDRRIM